jgi:hypothetical protein
MGLAAVQLPKKRWPDASADVFLTSDWLKVIWPNTAPVPAKMVKFQAIRNRANGKFITQAVRVNLLARPAPDGDHAIAISADRAVPIPTGIRPHYPSLE